MGGGVTFLRFGTQNRPSEFGPTQIFVFGPTQQLRGERRIQRSISKSSDGASGSWKKITVNGLFEDCAKDKDELKSALLKRITKS